MRDADLSRVSGNENEAAAVRVEQNPAPREASGRAQQADVEAAQGARQRQCEGGAGHTRR